MESDPLDELVEGSLLDEPGEDSPELAVDSGVVVDEELVAEPDLLLEPLEEARLSLR